ncbi:hypothetical protein ACFX13_043828 [Malus domestica]
MKKVGAEPPFPSIVLPNRVSANSLRYPPVFLGVVAERASTKSRSYIIALFHSSTNSDCSSFFENRFDNDGRGTCHLGKSNLGFAGSWVLSFFVIFASVERMEQEMAEATAELGCRRDAGAAGMDLMSLIAAFLLELKRPRRKERKEATIRPMGAVGGVGGGRRVF